MEGRVVQGSEDLEFDYVNPNPGLWEYKVKTGRGYPNTKEEWEVFKTWYKGTHAYLQAQACKLQKEGVEKAI